MRISMTSSAPAGSLPVSGRRCSSMTGAGPVNSRSSNPRSLVRVWCSRACRERANSTRGAGGRHPCEPADAGAREAVARRRLGGSSRVPMHCPVRGRRRARRMSRPAPTDRSRIPRAARDRILRRGCELRSRRETAQRRPERLRLRGPSRGRHFVDRVGASRRGIRRDGRRAEELARTWQASRARRAAWPAGAGPARVARTDPGTPCGEPPSRTRPRPANA